MLLFSGDGHFICQMEETTLPGKVLDLAVPQEPTSLNTKSKAVLARTDSLVDSAAILFCLIV